MRRFITNIVLLLAGTVSVYGQGKADTLAMSEATKDSLLKDRLVVLAMQNPSLQGRDAQVNYSKYQYRKSKSAWLEVISVQANVNEFVVNNSPNAFNYPKYNAGLNVPLNVFGKAANDKKSARELVKVAEAEKLEEARRIKKEVLTRYENYKEKKDIYEFNRRLTIGRRTTYTSLQNDFDAGTIDRIEDVNKAGQEVTDQEITERTSKRDYIVAVLELEEIIGNDLDSVIESINARPAK